MRKLLPLGIVLAWVLVEGITVVATNDFQIESRQVLEKLDDNRIDKPLSPIDNTESDTEVGGESDIGSGDNSDTGSEGGGDSATSEGEDNGNTPEGGGNNIGGGNHNTGGGNNPGEGSNNTGEGNNPGGGNHNTGGGNNPGGGNNNTGGGNNPGSGNNNTGGSHNTGSGNNNTGGSTSSGSGINSGVGNNTNNVVTNPATNPNMGITPSDEQIEDAITFITDENDDIDEEDELTEEVEESEFFQQLEALIETLENKELQSDNYTEASWMAFEEALRQAKELIVDEEVSEEDLETMIEILQTAFNNLEIIEIEEVVEEEARTITPELIFIIFSVIGTLIFVILFFIEKKVKKSNKSW